MRAFGDGAIEPGVEPDDAARRDGQAFGVKEILSHGARDRQAPELRRDFGEHHVVAGQREEARVDAVVGDIARRGVVEDHQIATGVEQHRGAAQYDPADRGRRCADDQRARQQAGFEGFARPRHQPFGTVGDAHQRTDAGLATAISDDVVALRWIGEWRVGDHRRTVAEADRRPDAVDHEHDFGAAERRRGGIGDADRLGTDRQGSAAVGLIGALRADQQARCIEVGELRRTDAQRAVGRGRAVSRGDLEHRRD